MLVVGSNLDALIKQHGIASPESFDGNSITLHMGDIAFVPKVEKGERIKYPFSFVDSYFEKVEINTEFPIDPGGSVLICSREYIRIPMGYFGLIQTKGSLARLFCAAHLSDGQVEGGFEGVVTLEIANLGPFELSLQRGAPVAQLFIFMTSTDNADPYNGRYGSQSILTIFKPLMK